ncbi:MAG: hypothetical protein K9I95_14115 [Flavobacteriaceae bacterium]|nr:hypothetical protein [Flavobacteriaceae bacterium]
MKLPLRPTYLMKIPYFEVLFNSRFEGFEEDFATYFNHVLETNPEDNFKLFLDLYQSETDLERKIIINNLGVFYYRYQKNYWGKRPDSTYNFLVWEESFKTLLPTYNESFDANILIGPQWEKLTESYSRFIIAEPDFNAYIINGFDMMFLDETVPRELLPAFALSILVVYYKHKIEIEDFLETKDPTYKII